MANTTITNLPMAISLTGTEQMEAVQSGSSVRVTASQVAGLAIIGPTTVSPSTSTETSGTIRWDANYIYVCVATNTWKHATLNSY
jgi:hypothetical protein